MHARVRFGVTSCANTLPPWKHHFPATYNLSGRYELHGTHTQKKKQTNQRGGWRHETKQLWSPSARLSPTANESRKEKNKKRAWSFGLAAMEAGDLRRSCNTQNRDNSGPKLEGKESPGVCTWQLSSDWGYAWLHFHRIHTTVSVALDGCWLLALWHGVFELLTDSDGWRHKSHVNRWVNNTLQEMTWVQNIVQNEESAHSSRC